MNEHRDRFSKRIMIALDVDTQEAAKKLIHQIEGIPCMLKVGMQLFYATGPELIKELKALGFQVFLDVKLHDIPNTVKGAARSITQLGVDMFNVHVAGGLSMMQAAMDGVHQAMRERSHVLDTPPIVVGVTQLTSTNQWMLNEEIGISGSIADCVLRYARLSQQAGLHGVVAAAHEVPFIKEICGDSFLTVTPGIRLRGDDYQDQSRVMTPEQAFATGTDYIVLGRSITRDKDPRGRLEMILHSLQSEGA